MRAVKVALLAVVACIAGTASMARACDVHGQVVCANDTTKPVSGVQVTLQSPIDTVVLTSGADGTYSGGVTGWQQWYDVSYTDTNYWCGPETPSLYIAPLLVDDPQQCGTVPACVPTMPQGITFPYCPVRPLGNPKAECSLFGLVVLDKVEGVSQYASTDAPLAIIKAGGCYGILEGVTAGDPLTSPNGQAISHVTYCTCD